jgi:hypothetical protein
MDVGRDIISYIVFPNDPPIGTMMHRSEMLIRTMSGREALQTSLVASLTAPSNLLYEKKK